MGSQSVDPFKSSVRVPHQSTSISRVHDILGETREGPMNPEHQTARVSELYPSLEFKCHSLSLVPNSYLGNHAAEELEAPNDLPLQ